MVKVDSNTKAKSPAKELATMRDVAERAGVALTTVSRAFSTPDKLSPETRRRIESACAALDYTLNLNARSLRRKSSGTVLVLLPDIGNPFFALVLKGIEEAAREGGRMLLIGDTGKDPVLAAGYASQLEARTADALILLDGHLPFESGSPSRVRLLRSPLVAVSERIEEAGIPYVGIDNVAAARVVAHHLADLGHREVATIRGPVGNILTGERERGFASGAAERGLEVLGSLPGDFTIAAGRAAARSLLSWPKRPTAIFAANDETAMGAIDVFKAAGLSLPEDMSVVGFDDIAFAEICAPTLTTIRQPRGAMGRAAMDVVVAQIDNLAPPEPNIILDFELIRRASTAPPGRRAIG